MARSLATVTPPRRASAWERVGLGGILLVAAALRLVALDQYPPGLHSDEAVNGWNAYCLLKTGRDQFGAAWPVFYIRALGENRSALFCYLLLPFQALGGLNLWTLRLPAALAGVLTVGLLYWVGRRLFDRPTGLIAAALLAVLPAHIQMTRWGHEASVAPLLVLLPLAALLWAGLPPADGAGPRRIGRAALAGLLSGTCCYGYPAVRLFLPPFLCAVGLLNWRRWSTAARTPGGRGAALAYVVGLVLTFGPLVYMHVTYPEVMNKRGHMTWIWRAADPLSQQVLSVLERYSGHFGLDFLFRYGDVDETVWAVPFGYLPRYYGVLLVAGLAVAAWRFRRCAGARVLLAGVALFPFGDALNYHPSLHGLRSSVGLWSLALVAALGLARVWHWLHARRLTASLALASGLLGIWVPMHTIRPLYEYFCVRPRKALVYYGDHVDLLAACDWLRPRLAETDVVICYPAGPNPGFTKYAVTLVALQHDPLRWFAEPRVVDMRGEWDRYSRYGKFHFLFPDERRALLEELRHNGQVDRVVLILRPNDPVPFEPSERIAAPGGTTALHIYTAEL
jgi:4-amino-4-deoxy-L-arabinose transferase-like glycosyltransferase